MSGWDDGGNDWRAAHEERLRKARFKYRVKGAAVVYAAGQAIGTAAYVMQTGRTTPAALGAGAFLGVVIGVGHFMRSG